LEPCLLPGISSKCITFAGGKTVPMLAVRSLLLRTQKQRRDTKMTRTRANTPIAMPTFPPVESLGGGDAVVVPVGVVVGDTVAGVVISLLVEPVVVLVG
jgi:hypothetical protein